MLSPVIEGGDRQKADDRGGSHTPRRTPTIEGVHTPRRTPTIEGVHTPRRTPTIEGVHTPRRTPTIEGVHTPRRTPTIEGVHTPRRTPTIEARTEEMARGSWPVTLAAVVVVLGGLVLQARPAEGDTIDPTTTAHTKPEGAGINEYCETELFSASCKEDEVIFMERALYGRMRLGRCVKKDLGFIGCYTNVIGLANWKCSGRRHCNVRIPDPDFDTTMPCLQELKTYFEASYICVKVMMVANDTCRIAPQMVHKSGYIASLATQDTGCGTSSRPYLVQAHAGQRLNITLYDFSGEHANSKGSALCWRYAVIKEKSVARSTVVCSGKERVKHVYLSSNNSIEVSVVGDRPSKELRYFLLKYEVVGCPDFEPATHMWFRREKEDVATVGCVTSGQQWRLTCVGNTWVGKMGNCTHFELVSHGHTEPANHQMSVGTSMVIIFGIAIGIGVIVFLIGFVSFKRCRGVKARKGGPHMTLRSGYPVELELDESRREKCKAGFAEMSSAHQQQQQQHQQHQPPTTVGYHSLKLNGNEYTHIWETPVPTQTQVKDFLDEGIDSPTKERRLSHPELIFMRHAQCEHQHAHAREGVRGEGGAGGDMTLPRAAPRTKGLPTTVLHAAEDFSYDPPRYFLVNREVWASNVPPYPGEGGEGGVLDVVEPDVHSHIHPSQPLPHTQPLPHSHHAPHCSAHAAELAAAAALSGNGGTTDCQAVKKC